MSEGERRLAAIMYTDIVGYTSLTQKDESATLQALEKHRNLLRPHFSSHGGREIKTIGDAFLVEFRSALDAVLCATAIQQMMHDRKVATGETISLRIGIHVGDVVEKGNDILGDAVNVASRIEPLAMPGGIYVSQQVYDHVKNKFEFPLTSIGKRELKNVGEPMEVYKVLMPWEQQPAKEEIVLPRDRIAILPFRNMSSDPNDEYFAEGMTEEIISTVSGISGLEVISRTSVMGYKGTTKKVKEIGRELEVGSVLEGSFRKAGNRIRVTTQLIDVARDKHLWAQNYDRNLDDVFEVQSDVATQVADALRVEILVSEKERIEKKPTESTLAYTLYLKGRQLWNTRKLDDVRKAREYFELAVKEDPVFALGYAGQADCCHVLSNNFGIDPDANLVRAKDLASRALELDPGLAEAHATLGSFLRDTRKYQESEEEFRKAIELKPSYASAHQWYSILLLNRRRWDESLKQIEKAQELDPLSPIIAWNHSNCLWALGRVPDALQVLETAERLIPDSLFIKVSRGGALWYLGRAGEACESWDRAAKVDPDDMGLLDLRGHYEQYVGNYEKALELWERGRRIGKAGGISVTRYMPDFVSVHWLKGDRIRAIESIKEIETMPERNLDERSTKEFMLAFAYAATGDSESFFPAVERLIEEYNIDFGVLRGLSNAYPASREFAKDARWGALFRRVGLEP